MRTWPIFLFGALTAGAVASVALGADWDRKAPAPLPAAKRLCLYVEGFPGKCQNIEAKVLKRWRLTPGQTVSVQTMIQIDDDNRAFRSTKYR